MPVESILIGIVPAINKLTEQMIQTRQIKKRLELQITIVCSEKADMFLSEEDWANVLGVSSVYFKRVVL